VVYFIFLQDKANIFSLGSHCVFLLTKFLPGMSGWEEDIVSLINN